MCVCLCVCLCVISLLHPCFLHPKVITEIKKKKGIKLDLEMEASDWKQVSTAAEHNIPRCVYNPLRKLLHTVALIFPHFAQGIATTVHVLLFLAAQKGKGKAALYVYSLLSFAQPADVSMHRLSPHQARGVVVLLLSPLPYPAELSTSIDLSQLLEIENEQVVDEFKKLNPNVPTNPREQLRGAVLAVFRSWNNDRAIRYRSYNGIPDEWGTAVSVQVCGGGAGLSTNRFPRHARNLRPFCGVN